MLKLCGIVAAILKMATGRNFSMSGINSGHHNLPTYEMTPETAEQISIKLARNVHWMVLYQICVFGTDLKSNMAARAHNVFSLAEILKNLLVRNHQAN